MNARERLLNAQSDNNSIICLGLDLDIKKMPPEYTKSSKGRFDFARAIIEATSDIVCAYKPNVAFYESFGAEGLSLLKMIIERIPKSVPVIVDAKRGDIGNTASQYAHALYDELHADWVTLSPYMGYDSLRPFLEYKDRGVFVLCLTSNPGSKDFQMLEIDGKPLYQIVAEKVSYWNKADNCGLVVGATAPEELKIVRQLADSMPLLIPGVGAQGGSLEAAALHGTDQFRKPALINVSRSILYASREDDFATRARQELIKLNDIISELRTGKQHSSTHNPRSEEQQTSPPPIPPTPQAPPVIGSNSADQQIESNREDQSNSNSNNE